VSSVLQTIIWTSRVTSITLDGGAEAYAMIPGTKLHEPVSGNDATSYLQLLYWLHLFVLHKSTRTCLNIWK
jgi:hypothetical protein